ncbi:yippee-domain-containing protein [Trematosphaeria pertusa]|uniref:Yippee-domain-containing protein n=1 Tax=Trematosphaeria pertusa TaxID=390896 RepID=A0A6A6I4H8_9PLEO|nr:yippee-domain-containing protein [Trematosphaeria pertusa]KAF2244862.1 yippee-domain-containing protein [Trematosphaeria pertusa]
MAISSAPPTPFPLYLLPSIPFRRRRSSALSTSTTSSPSSSPPSKPTSFLSAAPTSHLRCSKCLTDLIPTSSIISKGFTGRHGRAYLVSPPPTAALYPRGSLPPNELGAADLPNTLTHKPVPRQLVTGAHTVSDISCRTCGSVLGWKYVEAEEESQRYKVGKFILETKRVVRGTGWEFDGDVDGGESEGKTARDEEVEFDSQDEDECEDLFSGIWSAQLARRRRKNRGWREDE